MPLVSRTRATLRSAEFGFFGVVVYTRVHTPRRWGEPFSAGVLVFSTLSSRPLRTSWLIVGMGGLDLLPALGRALECVALLVVPGCRSCWRTSRLRPRRTVRPPRSGVSPFPGPARCRTELGCPSRLGAATLRRNRRAVPGDREGHPGAPRTGAGPGHPGHSSPQYPCPGDRSKPGPHALGHRPVKARPGAADGGQNGTRIHRFMGVRSTGMTERCRILDLRSVGPEQLPPEDRVYP